MSKKSMRKRVLSFVGMRLLMRMARYCLWNAKDSQWCWICGAAPGMGPIWAGPHMTCQDCYNRWGSFHNNLLIVDWRGIGRPRTKGEMIDEV